MIRTLLALCALIFSFMVPLSSFAQETFLALPSQSMDDPNALIAPARSAFDNLGPDGRLVVINMADGALVTDVKIADKPRYERDSFKRRDYAGPLSAIQNHVRAANTNTVTSPEHIQSNVIATLDAIGDLRTDRRQPARVLIIGNGLHQVPQNASLSMLGADGVIKRPNSGFLLADRSVSPYGQRQDMTYLDGVEAHFCAYLPSSVTPHEKDELAGFYANYFSLRGGKLITFTTDIFACISRFEDGIDTPLEARPLNPTISPSMVAASMAGTVTQVTINRLSELEDAVDREKREAGERIAELEAQNAELNLVNASLEDRLAQEGAAREISEAEVERYKDALGQNANGEVTDFSKFTHVPHPTWPSLTISTGVSYDTGFPNQYETSWCYFNRVQASGTTVKIEIGSKPRSRAVQWESVSDAALREVGVTRRQFDDARQSCRFPQS